MKRGFRVPKCIMREDEEPVAVWKINRGKALAEAKKLFLESPETDKPLTLKQIQKITGVPTMTLLAHIYRGKEPWVYDKLKAEEEVLATRREVAKMVKESLRPELQRLYGIGVSVLKNSLEAAEAKGQRLPIEKLPKLVDSLDKIDRWVRLNDGEATSITKNIQESLTEDDIRKEMERLSAIDAGVVDWDGTNKIN